MLFVILTLIVNHNNNQVNASLSWPSFLGGSSGTPAPTVNLPEPVVVTPPTYLLSPQYPIWRVHQYNGIHLKPVDMSQLPQSLKTAPEVFPSHPPAEFDVDGSGSLQVLQTNDIDPRQPDSEIASEDGTDLPAELMEMATSLGVTDMSKLPTLNEAMSLLGTTSAAETVSVIRDIASTENGQSLIRQFLQNSEDELSSSEEGDISASQQQPSVLDVEAEAAEQEPQESVLNEERGFFGSVGDALVDRSNADQEVIPPTTDDIPAPASNSGGIFSIITNFFRPAPPTVPLDSLTESTVVAQVTPPAPISVPQLIPSSPFNIQSSDYDKVVRQYYGRPVAQLNDAFSASFPTLSLPRLPNINQTPNLPSNFQNLPPVPQLPNIRIPTYQSPSAYSPPSSSSHAQPGTYIRVRYPLAAFQPPQMQQQQLPRLSNHISASTPQRAIIQSAIAVPMSINNEPMVFELPHPHPNQIVRTTPAEHRSRTPASTYSDISQLPLSTENFNAFRNAPHIVTSYGTPALPFTFDSDSEEPQPAASNHVPVVIHQLNSADDSNPSNESDVIIDSESTQMAQRRSASVSPQRITAYDVVATGRLGQRANAEAIEAAIPTQKSPVIDYGK